VGIALFSASDPAGMPVLEQGTARTPRARAAPAGSINCNSLAALSECARQQSSLLMSLQTRGKRRGPTLPARRRLSATNSEITIGGVVQSQCPATNVAPFPARTAPRRVPALVNQDVWPAPAASNSPAREPILHPLFCRRRLEDADRPPCHVTKLVEHSSMAENPVARTCDSGKIRGCEAILVCGTLEAHARAAHNMFLFSRAIASGETLSSKSGQHLCGRTSTSCVLFFALEHRTFLSSWSKSYSFSGPPVNSDGKTCLPEALTAMFPYFYLKNVDLAAVRSPLHFPILL